MYSENWAMALSGTRHTSLQGEKLLTGHMFGCDIISRLGAGLHSFICYGALNIATCFYSCF